ncbi:MAG: RNA polymerase sigma factor [Limisphaerales bacterium]
MRFKSVKDSAGPARLIGVLNRFPWLPVFAASSGGAAHATFNPAPMNPDDPLPTRASLLHAVKDAGNHAGWDEFHRTYRGLLVGVARRSGLNEHEAEEAVQDTLLAVAQKMPEFQYVPGKDSFKGWLLQLARWKIADQFRKRAGHAKRAAPSDDDRTQVTAGGSIARSPQHLPDPATDFDALWETEWQQLRIREALARVKRQVNPAHYAIYHLHVIEERPAAEVSRTLGVNRAQIYLAKHRVGAALKREITRMKQKASGDPNS